MTITTQTSGFSKYDPTSLVVDAVFKEFYLPGVRDQLNNKRILSTLFARRSEHISSDGKYAVIALNTGRNNSSMSNDEYGRLPKPAKQVYKQAQYRMRYNYARISVTGQAMGSSRTNRGAFIRALDAEMQGVVRDRQIEDNRIYWGDGSGVLATCAGAAAGVVVTVLNPGGFTNPGPGTQYFKVGQLVGFVNPASAPMALLTGGGVQAFEITAIDAAAGTITFTGATLPVVAAGFRIVRVAWEDVVTTERRSTSYLNEPFGLAAIVSDGNPVGHTGAPAITHNLGEIDATVDQIWQAPIVDNNGSPVPFNQGMLDAGMDSLDIAGDGVVRIWMTSHGIRRQYLHDMVANKRYVNTTSIGDGTFSAVEHNGVPIVVDRDATRGRIYGLDPSSLIMFTETDYFWMDGDNSVLVRDPDRDLYHATLARYCECGTDKRNANVLVKDISDN